MLLYAIYTPPNQRYTHVYAFASVERFVNCMRLVNEEGRYDGTLRPITKDEALKVGMCATLVIGADELFRNRCLPVYYIRENRLGAIPGSPEVEVRLVECAKDEIYTSIKCSPEQRGQKMKLTIEFNGAKELAALIHAIQEQPEGGTGKG